MSRNQAQPFAADGVVDVDDDVDATGTAAGRRTEADVAGAGGPADQADANPDDGTAPVAAPAVEEPADRMAQVGTGTAQSPPERAAGPSKAVLAVAILLAVGLVAAATVLGVLVMDSHTRDADRAGAVQTARQVAVNLATLDHVNPQASLDQVLAGSTGAFRQQFADQSKAIAGVLKQAQVSSSGDVTDAGLAEFDDTHAVVLVASTATVRNVQAPQGEPRQYRIKMTMERHPETPTGWLVSAVDFVP